MNDINQTLNLRNHFLLAMPSLEDPNFAHTVTYIFEHNEQGAMGIVINKPLNVTVGDIFKQLDIEGEPTTTSQAPIFAGGPVQTERGFVIHAPMPKSPKWESSIHMSKSICITTSKDILEAIAHDQGPSDFLVALGYAGWTAGQLEAELAANAWIFAPADTNVLFHLPSDKRLAGAAQLLGIDLLLLSSDVGHA